MWQARKQPFFHVLILLDKEHPYPGQPVECILVALQQRFIVSTALEYEKRIPSDGCSKPRSLIARKSSGFNRKSLPGQES